MHYKWKEWQEDAALDAKLAKMRYQRQQKLIEIYYHQHYISLQQSLLAQMCGKLYTAKYEYEQMDLDLAIHDGRLSYISNDVVKRQSKKIDKKIKDMSLDERLKLISELEAMD